MGERDPFIVGLEDTISRVLAEKAELFDALRLTESERDALRAEVDRLRADLRALAAVARPFAQEPTTYSSNEADWIDRSGLPTWTAGESLVKSRALADVLARVDGTPA